MPGFVKMATLDRRDVKGSGIRIAQGGGEEIDQLSRRLVNLSRRIDLC